MVVCTGHDGCVVCCGWVVCRWHSNGTFYRLGRPSRRKSLTHACYTVLSSLLLFYSTRCHDPPLKRVPTKNKYRLWQCADCDSSEDSEDSDAGAALVDVDAPRPVRSKRGLPPSRFSVDHEDEGLLHEAVSVSRGASSSTTSASGGKKKTKQGKQRRKGKRRSVQPPSSNGADGSDTCTDDDLAHHVTVIPVDPIGPAVHTPPKPNPRTRPLDPDSMCMVARKEDGLPCRRSLSCKRHRLGDRRDVPGRSRPFDDLLHAHLRAQGKVPPKRSSRSKASSSVSSSGSAGRKQAARRQVLSSPPPGKDQGCASSRNRTGSLVLDADDWMGTSARSSKRSRLMGQ
eukprot:m.72712 g.72712  ORF g.72712 m.72712 type:complete len:342 (-) comp8797_c0_seq2:69-1094(-)